jgi:hypothetical protein
LENNDLRRRADPKRHDRALCARRSINKIAFETYVEKVLVPELKPSGVVVMDNLTS